MTIIQKGERMSDLISRQAAIDAMKEHRALYCDNTPDAFSKLSHAEKSRVDELDTAIATLVNLPPAEPNRGTWIDTGSNEGWYAREYRCSECGDTMLGEANYCPNCGADMREVTE